MCVNEVFLNGVSVGCVGAEIVAVIYLYCNFNEKYNAEKQKEFHCSWKLLAQMKVNKVTKS